MKDEKKISQDKPKVDKAVLDAAIKEKQKALAENKIIQKDGKDHHS